jgi:hypothetical protein
MADEKKKGWFRAFLDFFVLFSGVSTASNLSRTQPRPVRNRGLFLFRTKPKDEPRAKDEPSQSPPEGPSVSPQDK